MPGASGNYIDEIDIDNFTDAQDEDARQGNIEYAEALVEKVTKDIFRPVDFSIFRDGNGESRLNLGLLPNILSITSIEISGVALSSSYYTFDKHHVYLDSGSAFNEAELRYLMRRAGQRALFPSGLGNIQIIGTMGWPEKLGIKTVTGTFQAGEIITEDVSDITAIVKQVRSTYLLIGGRGSTNFTDNLKITGGTSAAYGNVDSAVGAVSNPPLAIKEAIIIVCRKRNDPTLYTDYNLGSERIADMSYSTTERPLTGIREADLLLRKYVRRKPRMAAV